MDVPEPDLQSKTRPQTAAEKLDRIGEMRRIANALIAGTYRVRAAIQHLDGTDMFGLPPHSTRLRRRV
jgi:hypothetical protein